MTKNKPNKINVTKYLLRKETIQIYFDENDLKNCKMVTRGVHNVNGDAILIYLPPGKDGEWSFKNDKETVAFLSKYMTLVEEKNL